MTLLKGDDYFAAPELTVTVERRLPQSVFPEHYHDFHEIMLVESGSGVHIFNDHPYTLTAGTVCFVRASDHHLFENVENLRLTNVLFRSPKAFRFIQDVGHFLPQEHHYQSQIHWQLSPHVLAQVLECIAQLEALPDSIEMEHIRTVSSHNCETPLKTRSINCCNGSSHITVKKLTGLRPPNVFLWRCAPCTGR
jgi:AraC family L-rhamnose operon regulatory protein RhaS